MGRIRPLDLFVIRFLNQQTRLEEAMNPYTNEVVDLEYLQKQREADGKARAQLDELMQSLGEGFEPVPEELENAARRVLRGRDRATVSKDSGGVLSKHSSRRRAELGSQGRSRR